MDLSKAHDRLPNDLLIWKLDFNFNSLCLMYSYLDCRHRKVKIGSYKNIAKIIRTGELEYRRDLS